MKIGLTIRQGEEEKANRLLDWMEKIQTPMSEVVIATEVGVLSRPATFQFTDEFHHFPESVNLAFQQIAGYMKMKFPGEPFAYLEADSVPLRAGWFEAIKAEYQKALAQRKVFMGDVVKVSGYPDTISPVAVYPSSMTDYAGEAMVAHDNYPWTYAAASQIQGKLYQTPLIRHGWDGMNLASIPPECVLIHPDRGGILASLSGGVESQTRSAQNADGYGAQGPGDTSETPGTNVIKPSSESSDSPAQLSGAVDGTHLDGAQVAIPDSPEAAPEPYSVDVVRDMLNNMPAPEVVRRELVDGEGRFVHGLGNTTRQLKRGITYYDPTQKKWADKEAAHQRIKELCRELLTYCDAPLHTARVRLELKVFGVSAGISTIKKMRIRRAKLG